MFQKVFLAVAFIIISSSSFGQKSIRVETTDSIKLTMQPSSDGKTFKISAHSSSGNFDSTYTFSKNTSRPFSSKDSNSFYTGLKTLVGASLLGKGVTDSIKRQEKFFRDSIIEVNISLGGKNTIAKDSIPPHPWYHHFTLGYDGITLEPMQVGGLALIFIAIVILVYVFIRARGKRNFQDYTDDTTKVDRIVVPVDNRDVDDHQLMILKKIGCTKFPKSSEQKQQAILDHIKKLDDTGAKLKEKCKDLETRITEITREYQKDIEQKTAQLALKDREVLLLQSEMAEKNSLVTNLQHDIEATQTRTKELSQLSKELIHKYYDSTFVSIKNNDYDAKDRNHILLSNLLTLSFHATSLLRKNIGMATDTDFDNVELLNGNYKQPKGTVSEHSPEYSCDAMAYAVYHLLRDQGVQKLENVLVHGFKIGE